MQTTMRILQYILITIGVLIVGGFAGWYIYLRSQAETTSSIDTARGLNALTLSFGGGSGGNTQANIAQSKIVAEGNRTTYSPNAKGDLWEIEHTPVAGFGFMTSTTSTSSVIHFAMRATGFIMNADPSTHIVTRLSDTLTPKTYEALFAPNGTIIERTIGNDGAITTFIGAIASSTSATSTSRALRGKQLSSNIRFITFNKSGASILYLVESTRGTVGMTAKKDGTSIVQVFTSTIGSWRPLWLSNGDIILLESPTDNAAGYAYRLQKNGTTQLLIGNIPGLTILPHFNSKALIYGSTRGGALALFGTLNQSTTTNLGMATIADKCVWSTTLNTIAYCAVPTVPPTGQFLNDWYQGIVHTSDQWWKVDVSTGVSQVIYSPSKDNVSLDVENPTIDASGAYIAFMNAKDKSLWLLRLKQ